MGVGGRRRARARAREARGRGRVARCALRVARCARVGGGAALTSTTEMSPPSASREGDPNWAKMRIRSAYWPCRSPNTLMGAESRSSVGSASKISCVRSHSRTTSSAVRGKEPSAAGAHVLGFRSSASALRPMPSSDGMRASAALPSRFDSCGSRSMVIVRESFVAHATSARRAICTSGCEDAPAPEVSSGRLSDSAGILCAGPVSSASSP